MLLIITHCSDAMQNKHVKSFFGQNLTNFTGKKWIRKYTLLVYFVSIPLSLMKRCLFGAEINNSTGHNRKSVQSRAGLVRTGWIPLSRGAVCNGSIQPMRNRCWISRPIRAHRGGTTSNKQAELSNSCGLSSAGFYFSCPEFRKTKGLNKWF